MGLFGNIFGKKVENFDPIDLSFIEVDMHSHLIPGVDDGASTLDDSIVMLAKFESLGYRKVITTPHIMSDFYKNTPDIILPKLDELREVAQKLNLKIEIEAAAEYYFDESLLTKLKSKEKLLTFGDNYVLFEFSFHTKPAFVDELIFEFVTNGYNPVLAHYERYAFLGGSIEFAEKWREQGVSIQMNLNSLGGHYGPEVQRTASTLVKNDLIDFLGTDCHRIDHLMTLENSLSLPEFQLLPNLTLKNQGLK